MRPISAYKKKKKKKKTKKQKTKTKKKTKQNKTKQNKTTTTTTTKTKQKTKQNKTKRKTKEKKVGPYSPHFGTFPSFHFQFSFFFSPFSISSLPLFPDRSADISWSEVSGGQSSPYPPNGQVVGLPFLKRLIKGIVTDSNNIFLWHESEDINKKNLFPKFQLIPSSNFQVMHDNVCFIAPIDYCVK